MAKTLISVTDRLDTFVSRYNQLVDIVGDLASLNTTEDSDIVGAINSIYSLVDSELDFRSKISVTDAGGDGSLTYSSSTGIITYTGPSASEVRAHFSSGTNTTYSSGAGTFSISDATIRGKISVTNVSGDGSLAYNSSTGVISYTGPSASETRAHFTATNISGDGSLAYDSARGSFDYTGPSASEVRSHFSAGGSLLYDSSTGRFSFTPGAVPSISEIRGYFSVTDNGGDGSFTYDSARGRFDYTGPSASEVRAHFGDSDGIIITAGQIGLRTPTRFRLFDSLGATLLDLYGAGSLT